MNSSQDKNEPSNSSLQLLQAYDSSDSCEEMDDANHNIVLEEIKTFTKNKPQSDLFKEVYANVILGSRDVNEVHESSEGRTDDADNVTKKNVINSSEHGPIDADIVEPQAAESPAAPVAESKNPVIDCEMLAPRDANRWSDEESSSEDSSQESESDSSSEWESLKGAGVTSDRCLYFSPWFISLPLHWNHLF